MNGNEISCLVESIHCLIDIEDSLYALISKSIGVSGPKDSLIKGKKASRRKAYSEGEKETEENEEAKERGASLVEKDAKKNLVKRLGKRIGLNFDNGIPIYLFTVQMELSRLLDKVLGIGAGILTLHDIININKKTFPEEVRSFFQVMEVYGFGSEIDISSCTTSMLME